MIATPEPTPVVRHLPTPWPVVLPCEEDDLVLLTNAKDATWKSIRSGRSVELKPGSISGIGADLDQLFPSPDQPNPELHVKCKSGGGHIDWAYTSRQLALAATYTLSNPPEPKPIACEPHELCDQLASGEIPNPLPPELADLNLSVNPAMQSLYDAIQTACEGGRCSGPFVTVGRAALGSADRNWQVAAVEPGNKAQGACPPGTGAWVRFVGGAGVPQSVGLCILHDEGLPGHPARADLELDLPGVRVGYSVTYVGVVRVTVANYPIASFEGNSLRLVGEAIGLRY